MSSNSKTQILKDLKEKSILVAREFNAPLEIVWRAYTESDLLDQWWGPHPWRAATKSMDFRAGGHWLYAMVGPDNEKHWALMNFLAIDPHKSYSIEDAFCDEEGNINPTLPVSKGSTVFSPTSNGTLVEFRMIYPSETDIQKIVEMGFEQGISLCFDQLAEMLERIKN